MRYESGGVAYLPVTSGPVVGANSTGQADPGSAVFAEDIYLIGGYGCTSRDPLDSVSIYSTGSGTWSAGPAYPQKAWGQACATLAGYIYCFGGDGAGLGSYRLDVVKGSWTRIHDLPEWYNDSQGQVAVADPGAGRIYVLGSSYNNQVKRDCLAYDPSTDSFTRKADMPFGNAWFAAGIANGAIYTIGGTHGNFVAVYNISSDRWNVTSAFLPGPPRYGMLRNPGVFNGLIPIVGGTEWGRIFYGQTYFYDTSNGTFLRGPDSLLPRDGVGGGVVGKSLYVLDGRDFSSLPWGLTFGEELKLGFLGQDA